MVGSSLCLGATLQGCFSGSDDPHVYEEDSTSSGRSKTSGAEPNGPCVKSGPIKASETWSPETCPDGVRLTALVEVNSPAELTIAPGTVIKGDSEGLLRILPSAALIARGTPEKKIVFTGWQQKSGSWLGLSIRSNNAKNVISFALVENVGGPDVAAGMRLQSDRSQSGSLELTDAEIRGSTRFGLYLDSAAHFTKFERVDIHDNQDGAAWAEAPAVSALRGAGNSFHGNGPSNLVRIEGGILLPITHDASWPDLSPAIYRVGGRDGGAMVYINAHLTIDAGAVFEMVGGSSLAVDGGASGLSAIGTASRPIVFRGISESGWAGVTFSDSTWAKNRLEYVHIHNATRAPESHVAGTASSSFRYPSVLVGGMPGNGTFLALSNVAFHGPNAAVVDVAATNHGTLAIEGSNTGAAGGDITVERF